MENQETQPEKTTTIDTPQAPIPAQQQNPVSHNQEAITNSPTIYTTSSINKQLFVLLIATFWVGLNFIGLILADIRAGVLRGEPETGWGIGIAVVLFGPPLILLSILTLLRIKQLKNRNQPIVRTVKAVAITTVVLFLLTVVYSYII